MPIQLSFSCKQCGLVRAKLTAQSRKEDQRLPDWLEEVKPVVALHHRVRSPRCGNTKLDFHMTGVLRPGETLQEAIDTIGFPV